MELILRNRLIVPFSDKDTFKVVFGDSQTFDFVLPTPHRAGDSYHLGIDQDRVVYPPSRPICAYSTSFTVSDGILTMTLKYNTSRLRDFVCTLKKPSPIYIQLDRVRNGSTETLLLDTLLALPSVLDSVNTVCEGDPLAELLDAKLDKPAVEGTAGQILSLDENGQNVWRDEQEIPEQVQADWDESDSESKAYIRNKPDLSVYVEKEEGKGLSTNDFTDADATKLGGIEDNAQVNVQADWDESDSGDDAYIRHKPGFAAVALTGDYDDLLDKPDLSAYSLVTETGSKLSMSLDQSNYVLTIGLLNSANTTLDSKTVDLPLESMIVSGSYANGVLTLTLQNGQTIDIDVSDLVSGLVPDTRTVNGHALSADVTVTAQDLGLATVATTGDYNDLINKPAVAQSDWDESDSTDPAYIENKPAIPTTSDINALIADALTFHNN